MRFVRLRGPDGVVEGHVDDTTIVWATGALTPLDVETLELAPPNQLLLPIEPPEVWCAGVTYESSRDAHVEGYGGDVYALAYEADRPELYLKDAGALRTVAPGMPIAVRSDSSWNVAEPEIGLVLGAGGDVIGMTIGNDVTSREIESANPLYLPQAKVYAGSCSIGPCVVDPVDGPLEIRMRILEGAREVWAGETTTARMKRTFHELVSWLLRDNPVPAGSVLLTGTGLVPPQEVSLAPGQRVEIHVPGIGTLANDVVLASELVERPAHA
jgi:2-dehydro-3-deoxy-D-arabinonate dehydratase